MKNQFLTLAASVGFACLLSQSCKSIYEPNMVHMPLMQNKNELTITVDGKNLQAAYAATDHIAVMANGFYTSESIGNDKEEQGGHGGLGEAAIGYYTGIPGSPFIFETYAGAGFGNAFLKNNVKDNNGNINRQTFSSDAVKYFIQPDIGYKSRYFDIAFGTRFSVINYSKPSTHNYPQQQIESDDLGKVGDAAYLFLEPAFTFRTGYKFLKLQLQYCRSFKLNNDPLNYSDELMSVGLFFDINNNTFKQ